MMMTRNNQIKTLEGTLETEFNTGTEEHPILSLTVVTDEIREAIGLDRRATRLLMQEIDEFLQSIKDGEG